MKIDKMEYDRDAKAMDQQITLKPEGARLLDGKVAIVTGAGLGIGRATVMRFLAEGAKVVFTDLQDDVGEANEKFLTEQGFDVMYVHCDAFDRNQVHAMVQKTIERYGRIDILDNNAGYNVKGRIGTPDATPSKFRQMVGVHGLAHCYTIWEVLPYMKAQGGGTILEFGSTSSVRASLRDPYYCFAKAGVVQMTKCLCLELAKYNIRINAIAPGAVLTGMTMTNEGEKVPGFDAILSFSARGYAAEPWQIANVVTWLCSDESDYIDGQIIRCDGGIVS